MIQFLAGPLATIGGKLIDHLFETDQEKAAARAQLIKLEQDGQLEDLKTRLSVMLAEAQSRDPWTSRARPAFLYVIYLVILLCIFGGIIGIWWPDQVTQAAHNITALLGAIPGELWTLFGAGYLGYTGARSYDKSKRLTTKT